MNIPISKQEKGYLVVSDSTMAFFIDLENTNINLRIGKGEYFQVVTFEEFCGLFPFYKSKRCRTNI